MRIIGLSSWETPRAAMTAGAASVVKSSDEAASRKADVDNARATALSALRNDRFRSMLNQIGDPRFSDALMQMRSASTGTDAGLRTVQARYAENGE